MKDHGSIFSDPANAESKKEVLAEVARMEERRTAAMNRNDVSAMSEMMHESLKYTHSSGHVDSKSSYVGKLREGDLRYVLVESHNEAIELLEPGVAVATGKMSGTVRIAGAEKQIAGNYKIKWRKIEGHWYMVEAANVSLPS
ncbi:nuclear transport factor 2 family protein [Paraburkholderia solisilvae]|uniref:DUF4440 domain-containing protein n=1 Tax=Paraburkholderia solisilvae TaxID=624376 RepID=A0A6J5EZS9_9BURK|nr:nuclear transport factor 2 family protein [Paraburkholderia solisilvae]CAB3771663.1 hypothetical protein LMG29739_06081 [Paraburkholderia solisilvae]